MADDNARVFHKIIAVCERENIDIGIGLIRIFRELYTRGYLSTREVYMVHEKVT